MFISVLYCILVPFVFCLVVFLLWTGECEVRGLLGSADLNSDICLKYTKCRRQDESQETLGDVN